MVQKEVVFATTCVCPHEVVKLIYRTYQPTKKVWVQWLECLQDPQTTTLTARVAGELTAILMLFQGQTLPAHHIFPHELTKSLQQKGIVEGGKFVVVREVALRHSLSTLWLLHELALCAVALAKESGAHIFLVAARKNHCALYTRECLLTECGGPQVYNKTPLYLMQNNVANLYERLASLTGRLRPNAPTIHDTLAA